MTYWMVSEVPTLSPHWTCAKVTGKSQSQKIPARKLHSWHHLEYIGHPIYYIGHLISYWTFDILYWTSDILHFLKFSHIPTHSGNVKHCKCQVLFTWNVPWVWPLLLFMKCHLLYRFSNTVHLTYRYHFPVLVIDHIFFKFPTKTGFKDDSAATLTSNTCNTDQD